MQIKIVSTNDIKFHFRNQSTNSNDKLYYLRCLSSISWRRTSVINLVCRYLDHSHHYLNFHHHYNINSRISHMVAMRLISFRFFRSGKKYSFKLNITENIFLLVRIVIYFIFMFRFIIGDRHWFIIITIWMCFKRWIRYREGMKIFFSSTIK